MTNKDVPKSKRVLLNKYLNEKMKIAFEENIQEYEKLIQQNRDDIEKLEEENSSLKEEYEKACKEHEELSN